METDWSPSAAPEQGKLPPLEGLFHALAHEGRSVLMVSDDEALLDACGQSVVRKLRQSPGMEVSAMFDMDREVLLQRFNRLIENLSVDQALQSGGAAPTQQVWLQHIHNSQELEQAKLLIRLSTDFRAAGVKLLLMANNLCADDLIHHGQAKKLLVWHAPVMRKTAASTSPASAKPLAAAATAAPHWMDDAAASTPVEFAFTQPAPVSRSGKSQRWVVQLLLGVFVLVSVGVLGLHQWQASQAPVEAAVTDSPAASTDQGVVTQTTEAPVPTQEPVPVEPPSAAAAPATEAPVVVTPVVEPAAQVEAPAPATQPPTGAVWASGLKQGAWVVQHVALDSLDELKAWQAQHPALVDGQAVPLRRPTGQRYWVLVSGPFNSLELANAFASSPGVPKNHWSRGVASLQASLDRQP
jgi:hypothetical protein